MNDLEKVPNIDNDEEKKLNEEKIKNIENENEEFLVNNNEEIKNNDDIEKLINDHDKFIDSNDEEFFTISEELNNEYPTNTNNYKIDINNENINIIKNDEVINNNGINNLKVDDKMIITFKNGQIVNPNSIDNKEPIISEKETLIRDQNIDDSKLKYNKPNVLVTKALVNDENINNLKVEETKPIILDDQALVNNENINNLEIENKELDVFKIKENPVVDKKSEMPIIEVTSIVNDNVEKSSDIKDIKTLNNDEIKNIKNRIVILKKLANCLIHNQELIYQAYKKDTGKHEFDFIVIEFSKVLREIKYFVKKLKSIISKRYFIFSFANFGSKVKLNYEPYGRVFIIAPFNYPFYLALLPMVGALAAGNRVVLKLSEKSPALYEVLSNYLPQILNPQIFTMIDNNSTPKQIENIISHDLDLLFFTGSTKVGLILNEVCAKYNVKAILELGGANPTIVLEDANIEKFAKKIIWAKLFNSAQTCISPNHVYIKENKLEKFLNNLKDELDKQLNEKTIAELPFQQSLKNSSEGLSLYFEKDINSNLKFIVIKSDAQDKEVLNENFNIILPIVTYIDNNDLITKIKYLKDPLVTYFFTKDFKNPVIKQINDSLRSGSVVFNDFINFLYQNNIPFGGIGLSGSGKYQQKYSLEVFSYLRLYFYKNGVYDSSITYFPHNDKKMKTVNKIYKYKKYKKF